VVQVMVNIDWKDIDTSCDPDMPDDERPGPETVQPVTCDALQDICELAPARTRVGFAAMVTLGARTSTDAKAGVDVPPAPVQTT